MATSTVHLEISDFCILEWKHFLPYCTVRILMRQGLVDGLLFHSSSGVLLLPEGGAVTAMRTSQCCCLGDVYITFSAFCFAVMNGVGNGGVQYLLTQVKLPGSSVNVCMCAVNDNDDCKEQKCGVIKLSHRSLSAACRLFSPLQLLPSPCLAALKRPWVVALMGPRLLVFSWNDICALQLLSLGL